MFQVDILKFRVSKIIAFWLCLLPLLSDLPAQLSSDRSDLEKELRVIEVLLAEANARPGHTPSELAMIDRQIRLREKLLAVVGSEILDHEREIGEIDDQICAIEESTIEIKKNYAASARAIYQFKPEYSWLAILSSGSLNEAFYRLKFYRQVSLYQERQLEAMTKAQTTMQQKQDELTLAIANKETLREVRKMETSKLRLAISQRKEVSTLVRLEGPENGRLTQQKFIESTVQASAPSPTVNPPAPEEADLEVSLDFGTSFRKSKSRLPWPIGKETSTVIGEFGVHEDAYGISVNNQGIKLLTNLGQRVYSVHSGIVTAIQRIPNGGSVIIVAHGKYRTVYAGLGNVTVTLNQTVAQGQDLGLVRTDPRTGESSIEFMIYLEPSTFLDPLKWLH